MRFGDPGLFLTERDMAYYFGEHMSTKLGIYGPQGLIDLTTASRYFLYWYAVLDPLFNSKAPG